MTFLKFAEVSVSKIQEIPVHCNSGNWILHVTRSCSITCAFIATVAAAFMNFVDFLEVVAEGHE
jgi:hypothetical protein